MFLCWARRSGSGPCCVRRGARIGSLLHFCHGDLSLCHVFASCCTLTLLAAVGRYSDPGESTNQCSGECSPGRFCPAGTSTATMNSDSNRCDAGRHGGVGQSGSQCSGECSPGRFCPAGTSTATMNSDSNKCAAGSPPPHFCTLAIYLCVPFSLFPDLQPL